jgi:chaperonin GroES
VAVEANEPYSTTRSFLLLYKISLGVEILPLTFLFALKQALARSLAPLGDRVLVRRAPKETQTASGIFLPSDKTKDPNEGDVIAVGPGEKDVTGALHAVSLKAGDKVLLPEYGGSKVKIDDEELFLFRESEILGKFE